MSLIVFFSFTFSSNPFRCSSNPGFSMNFDQNPSAPLCTVHLSQIFSFPETLDNPSISPMILVRLSSESRSETGICRCLRGKLSVLKPQADTEGDQVGGSATVPSP